LGGAAALLLIAMLASGTLISMLRGIVDLIRCPQAATRWNFCKQHDRPAVGSSRP
jgi:hypothetical protein